MNPSVKPNLTRAAFVEDAWFDVSGQTAWPVTTAGWVTMGALVAAVAWIFAGLPGERVGVALFAFSAATVCGTSGWRPGRDAFDRAMRWVLGAVSVALIAIGAAVLLQLPGS